MERKAVSRFPDERVEDATGLEAHLSVKLDCALIGFGDGERQQFELACAQGMAGLRHKRFTKTLAAVLGK